MNPRRRLLLRKRAQKSVAPATEILEAPEVKTVPIPTVKAVETVPIPTVKVVEVKKATPTATVTKEVKKVAKKAPVKKRVSRKVPTTGKK